MSFLVKDKTRSAVFGLTLFSFVFLMMNREFSPMGIDLRLILVGLDFILFLQFIIGKNWKNGFDRFQKIVVWFVISVSLSFILTIFRPEYIDRAFQLRILFLYFLNSFTFLLLSMNFQFYSYKKLVRYVLISVIVLSISMIVAMIFKNTNIIFGNVPGIIEGKTITNFYGLNFRVAGFAEDANYASLSLVFTAILVFYSDIKKYIKYGIIIALAGIYGLAASKTILLGLAVAIAGVIFINLVFKTPRKNKYYFTRGIFIFIVVFLIMLIPAIVILTGLDQYIFANMSTMSQRYEMWGRALELFSKSPLLGGGLTATRGYFALIARPVQMHNTTVQALGDGGLLLFLPLFALYYKFAKSTIKPVQLIAIVFIVFTVTYETSHLLFLGFVMTVYYFIEYKKTSDTVQDVIFVNSLKQGGAEKIVAQLCDHLSNENDVYVFTQSKKDMAHATESKHVVYTSLSPKSLILSIFKINSIQEYYGLDGFQSVSAHLYRSHIMMFLSTAGYRGAYVFHGTTNSYSKGFVSQLIYRFIYRNKISVMLSNDIVNDFKDTFKLHFRETIVTRNFLDFEMLKRLGNEDFKKETDYILFAGRLEQIKNPMATLEAFNRLVETTTLNLVVLGEGSLRSELENYVSDHNLESRVFFRGYVENPYTWMKHAKVLVVTSEFESESLVIAEALYLGCPVVSVDCDFGPRNLMTEALSEYLVPINDTESLVATIHKAMTNYPSSYDQVFEGRSITTYVNNLREVYSGK